MVVEEKAVVLFRKPYGDSSWIYHLWGEESGRFSLLHKGAKKSKKKTSAFSASLVEINFKKSNQPEGLGMVYQIQAIDNFLAVQSNPILASIALFVCEFCAKELNEETDASVFKVLVKTLSNLEEHKRTTEHFYFLKAILDLHGITPVVGKLQYFDPEQSSYSHHPSLWNEQKSSLFTHWLSNEVPSHRKERQVLLSTILEYLEIQGFYRKRLKSIEVMTSYFND